MVQKEESEFKGRLSYILGLSGIILAASLLSPLGAIVCGISGMIIGKNQKGDLGKSARKLNTWALVIGIILFIFSIIATFYLQNIMGDLSGLSS